MVQSLSLSLVRVTYTYIINASIADTDQSMMCKYGGGKLILIAGYHVTITI